MARMWETPARTMGGRFARWDDAWAGDSTVPHRLLNRVIVVRRLDPSAAAGLAERVSRFYAARPDGGEYLVNDPWATLDLAPYGFTRWWTLPHMVRSPAPGPERNLDLEINEVHSTGDFEDFVTTLVAGFRVPELGGTPATRLLDERVLADGAMRCWVGFVSGRPVGTSVAYVSDGVVGVYLVSVLPAMRGRGFGEALTWQATLADRGAGHAPGQRDGPPAVRANGLPHGPRVCDLGQSRSESALASVGYSASRGATRSSA